MIGLMSRALPSSWLHYFIRKEKISERDEKNGNAKPAFAPGPQTARLLLYWVIIIISEKS